MRNKKLYRSEFCTLYFLVDFKNCEFQHNANSDPSISSNVFTFKWSKTRHCNNKVEIGEEGEQEHLRLWQTRTQSRNTWVDKARKAMKANPKRIKTFSYKSFKKRN